MALVFGIGAGLFALAIIWTLGILACLLFSRSGSLRVGSLGIGVILIVVTLVMFFYPREAVDEAALGSLLETEETDHLAIPRIIYYSVMFLFLAVTCLAIFLEVMLVPQFAPPVLAKKKMTF